MVALKAWIRASRPAGQTYIFFPLLLGQACAYFLTGHLDLGVLIVTQAFGVFDHLYIMYANDLADHESDQNNDTFTPFSGGSRVLLDGSLTPQALRRAAWLMVGLALLCGVILGVVWERWLPLPLMAFGLSLLWLYSFPPAQLSYRGGGELLQMIGVAAVLPLIGFSAHMGHLEGFPWPLLLVLLPTHLACAMATSLPDEPSDRLSNKRTTTVLLGAWPAKVAIIALNVAAILVFPFASWDLPIATDWRLMAVPTLSVALMTPLAPSAEPGTKPMLAFVFFAILTTLSIVVGLCFGLLV